MTQEEAFVALGVALGIGLLLGFEREQAARRDADGGRSPIGGVRTYPLVAVSGALAALAARSLGAWIVGAAFALLGTLAAISYARRVRTTDDHGLSSEVALLLAFLLGVLAPSEGLVEPPREKVIVLFSVTIVAAFLLSLKPALHALARSATKDDVFAALKFLLAAVVLLPLLPDRTIGPLDVFNPFRTGLLVVLIAGVEFAGYVLVRVLGGAGLGLAGLVGGLVSSTAVTLASASRARREPELTAPCVLSVVLANAVMAPRVLVIVSAVNGELARALAVPVTALALASAVIAWTWWRRAREVRAESDALRVANPFELTSALKLALLVTLVLFATKAAALHLGTAGVFGAAALAGTTDVDAISVSLAHLAPEGLATRVAAAAVLLAIASNTIVKTGIAFAAGGRTFGRHLVPPAAITLATVAAGALWLLR